MGGDRRGVSLGVARHHGLVPGVARPPARRGWRDLRLNDPSISRRLHMHPPLWAWFAVVAFIGAMLAVDLLVLHRKPHEVTLREAAVTSAGWVAISGAFGALIWVVGGASAAGEYTAG